MTETYLISFDDTDNLETVGTGHVLNWFLEAVPYDTGYITRHQLFVHDDVPFTSHNSAMCATVSGDVGFDEIVAEASQFLESECAEGSDPGLCIVCVSENIDAEALIEWGMRAKTEVLTKEDAYKVAQRCNVHLSEHGGDGQGVVGALAAVGLRLSGNDGRVRGRVEVAAGSMTVAELLEATGIDRVVANGQGALAEDCVVELGSSEVKAVFQDFSRTVLVTPISGGRYRLLGKQHLKRY